MIPFLHRIYQRLVTPVRRARWLHGVLFGAMPADMAYGGGWDWTTLALKTALRRRYRAGMALLDMGTGPYGTLATYACRRLHATDVTGCDHLRELIAHVARGMHADPIDFVVSDLFENIHRRFDIIVFNAPYMRTDVGERIGVLSDELSARRWSGGADGADTIRRFIALAGGYLRPGGVCLLGVNNRHLDDATVRAVISGCPDLRLAQVRTTRLTQSTVYLLARIESHAMHPMHTA